MIKFALKNVFKKRNSTKFAVIGIALGIGLMIILNSFSEGLSLRVTAEVQNSVGLVEVRQENATAGYLSCLDPSCEGTILNSAPNHELIVSSARGIVFPLSTTNLNGKLGVTTYGNNRQVRFTSVTPEHLLELYPTVEKIQEGSLYSTDSNDCIVPTLLNELFPQNFSIGSTIEFIINSTTKYDFQIIGLYRSNVDPHQINSQPLFDIIIGNTTGQMLWQKLLEPNNRELHLMSPLANPDGFSVFMVKYASTNLETTTGIVNNLKQYLDEIYPQIPHLVYARGKAQSSFASMQKQIQMFLLVVSIVTILTGCMSIIISQATSANQRIKEFAILKASGWRTRDILKDVMLESLIVGIIGGISGFILGYLGILAFGRFFANLADPVITYTTIGIWLGITLGLGSIGGISPALKAARTSPIVTLRDN